MGSAGCRDVFAATPQAAVHSLGILKMGTAPSSPPERAWEFISSSSMPSVTSDSTTTALHSQRGLGEGTALDPCALFGKRGPHSMLSGGRVSCTRNSLIHLYELFRTLQPGSASLCHAAPSASNSNPVLNGSSSAMWTWSPPWHPASAPSPALGCWELPSSTLCM